MNKQEATVTELLAKTYHRIPLLINSAKICNWSEVESSIFSIGKGDSYDS